MTAPGCSQPSPGWVQSSLLQLPVPLPSPDLGVQLDRVARVPRNKAGVRDASETAEPWEQRFRLRQTMAQRKCGPHMGNRPRPHGHPDLEMLAVLLRLSRTLGPGHRRRGPGPEAHLQFRRAHPIGGAIPPEHHPLKAARARVREQLVPSGLRTLPALSEPSHLQRVVVGEIAFQSVQSLMRKVCNGARRCMLEVERALERRCDERLPLAVEGELGRIGRHGA